MDCSPSEKMSLPLPMGEVVVINSSITTQDVLMSSPEKNIPPQNNISQEEEIKISQSGEVLSIYLRLY